MVATVLPLVASIGIPDSRHCLTIVVPVVTLMVFWWLLNRIDTVLLWLFPQHEWEKKLGWLNLRAERQADAFLRWVGYLIYGLLAISLYGIVWSAQALAMLDQMDNPLTVLEIVSRVPVLMVCLGFWLFYLGLFLIPKLRNQYEYDELLKFRAQQKLVEQERDRARSSRMSPNNPFAGKNPPLRTNRFGPGE